MARFLLLSLSLSLSLSLDHTVGACAVRA